MAKLCYIPRNFKPGTLAIIHAANKIIEQYQAKGYTLTLRQLYYQFVSRDLLMNNDANYDRLGTIISKARLAGLIDWDAIEDRGRFLRGLDTFKDAYAAVDGVRKAFLIDKWKPQEWRPEVWIEKDALIGVIAPICNELCVDYFGCRGYNSQSEQWRAGQRFARYYQNGQRPIVFHLGDHDPDGIDMTRDNRERLAMFAGVPVTLVRLALNMNQVEQYNPPPNPAKESSARYTQYAAEHGTSCWELDALDPEVLGGLIRYNVLQVRDEAKWNESLLEEAHGRQAINDVLEQLRPPQDD